MTPSHATTKATQTQFNKPFYNKTCSPSMPMHAEQFYHIYNRGNNKQRIFFNKKHYYFFMEKIKQFIRPHNFLLAYCLMPNHFHILIYTRASYKEDKFKNDFRTMLSSYTRAINLDMNRTGSLFQQNTKFKLIDPQDNFDPLICFNYIHLNPKRAFLVEHLKDWPYSSYPLYTQEKESKNVDTNFAKFILDLPEEPSFIETMTEDMA